MRVLLLFSFLSFASAHTHITQVIVDGQGKECIRPQHPQTPQSPVAQLYDPVTDLIMQDDYACGFMPYAGNPAPYSCAVQAGSQIQVQFYHGQIPGDTLADLYIASSHKGPIFVYMARHEQQGGIPGANAWFKVYEATIIQYGGGVNTPNRWASNDLLNQVGGKITIQIPADIQPGNYLLRTELVAYHDGRDRGRQPYVNCAELTVSGGGSASPGHISIPGGWDWSDPSLKYSIYTADPNAPFPVPGNYPVYKAGSNPTPSPTTPVNPTPIPTGTDTIVSTGGGKLESRLYDLLQAHCVIMQEDGNLVVYTYPAYDILWASGSSQDTSKGPFVLGIQDDGNLVIYGSGMKPYWTSGSWGKGVAPYTLKMQTDGNLVYYDSTGTAVWSTGLIVGDMGTPDLPPTLNNQTSASPNISLSPNNLSPFDNTSVSSASVMPIMLSLIAVFAICVAQ